MDINNDNNTLEIYFNKLNLFVCFLSIKIVSELNSELLSVFVKIFKSTVPHKTHKTISTFRIR